MVDAITAVMTWSRRCATRATWEPALMIDVVATSIRDAGDVGFGA